MREFSDLEKDILESLVKIQEKINTDDIDNFIGIELSLIVKPYLKENNLAMVVHDNTISALFDNRENDFEVVEKSFSVVMLLYSLSHLINYLVQNNLILISHSRIIMGTYYIHKLDLKKEFSDKFSHWPGLNEEITKKIIDQLGKTYLLSQDIILHVKNGFKSKADLYHEQNLRVALKNAYLADRNGNIAVLTAILGLLLSVLMALIQLIV